MEEKDYLVSINKNTNKDKLVQIIEWIQTNYQELKLLIKWNQPMFILNETFIIGFSVAKNHISIAPEKVILDEVSDQLIQYGYERKKMLFLVKKNQDIHWDLLSEIIDKSIELKKDYDKFWY